MTEGKKRIWSKNRSIWALMVLILASSVLVYSTYFHQLGQLPEQRVMETEPIECWIYDSSWETMMEIFQKQHPGIEVNVRVFHSYDSLYTELLAAISAGKAPDVAELNSFYGLANLVELGALQQTKLYEAVPFDMLPSAKAAFTYKEEQWAVPVGASVPVVFYNRDKLTRAGFAEVMPFADLTEMATALSAWVDSLSTRNVSLKWKQVLAVDDVLPFLFLNLWGRPGEEERQAKLKELLEAWNGLVFRSGIMSPLQHRLASSEFMNGETLFLISDSKNIQWLDRYIAGKFNYGMFLLPGAADQGLQPRIDGFAVLAGEDRSPYTAQLTGFLSSYGQQYSLFAGTGYIPVRLDVLSELERNTGQELLYKQLLDAKGLFRELRPAIDDERSWTEINRLMEQLEAVPESEAGTKELLHLLP
ncbi:extracellular solute-binding protein [Paenibacillus medicaginis]|uniref:Extracellular solute-binding protein n=1 Tax=Paenibacillus medicaginis TaxID=1470560 RepID=A0ABV5C9I4_9BACL